MSFNICNTIAAMIQLCLFFIAAYYMCISIFSFFPPRYRKTKDEKKRFAVVIPAHNEAKSLPALLKSLENQSYPREMYEVFVMADRCTDDTESLRNVYPIRILKRMTEDYSGKGATLGDALNQISAMNEGYDAYVIIDADNVADYGFLEEINLKMQEGHEVVQGYIDAKNPNDSWLSFAYAVWYWISNRAFQMGFSRLGIGCKLGGTGFAISKELLNDVPWVSGTLAEDAEYTTLLALSGRKVYYANRAVVYDEKPNDFVNSIFQRIRWSRGINQVQCDYSGRMLKGGHINAYLRFWSDLFMPLCFVIFLIIDIFATLGMAGLANAKFALFWTYPVPYIILNIYIFGTIIMTICGLLLDRKWDKKIVLNIFGIIIYFVSWIPAGLWGIFGKKNEWYHTKHK